MRLDGKVAMVTGAGSGLGRATAERFAAEGARVACVDLDGEAAERTAAAFGGTAFGADITDEAALAAAVDATGPVDVLFANAGIPAAGRVHETSAEAWRRVIDVNLTGAFLSAKAVLPGMLERGRGAIVLTSSLGGIAGVRGIAAYAAAKGGVAALTKQMAADYAELGVRVNAICPATILTPLVETTYLERRGGDEAAAAADLAERARSIPLGSLGEVDDVANLVLFLASDEAKWITGVVLPIDGGATAVSMWYPRPS